METENEVEELECALIMRRYVLKTKQTVWSKSSRRIVIWSPCLELPPEKEAESIPALRHHPKQNHQDVRFLSTDDIEKDSSPVYAQEKLSTEPKFKPTHGVAVMDSPPGDDFSYMRGDRFWLHIASRNSEAMGTFAAPVINLRTFKTGTILAPHVCWYPLARSPSGDLWTFGGLEKVVRGAKKQNWIWAVIQSIGNKTTVCDMVQVTPDCEMKPSERNAMFNEKLDRLAGDIRKSLPESYYSIKPNAPQKSNWKILRDVKEFMKTAPTKAASSYSISNMDRAFEAGQYPNKRRRLSPISGSSLGARANGKLPTPPQSRRYSSVSSLASPRPRGTYIPQTPDSVYDEVDGVLWSLFSSKPLDKPFLAADEIAEDPTLIRAAYDRALKQAKDSDQMGECGSSLCPRSLESDDHVAEEKAKMARYCSNGNPHCPDTQLVPHYRRQAHFHLPASKCAFSRADHQGSHMHCVTYHEWPGAQSGCIFRHWPETVNIPPGKNHTTCCIWTPEDLDASTRNQDLEKMKNTEHPSRREIEFRGSKRKEALKLGLTGLRPKTVDRRQFVKAPQITAAEVMAVSRDAEILREEADLLLNLSKPRKDSASLSKAVMEKEGRAREREKMASQQGREMQNTFMLESEQQNFSEQSQVPQQNAPPERHPIPEQQNTMDIGTSWQANGVALGNFPADFNSMTLQNNVSTPYEQNPNTSTADVSNQWMAMSSSNGHQPGTENMSTFSTFGLSQGFNNTEMEHIASQMQFGNNHVQNTWMSSGAIQAPNYSNPMGNAHNLGIGVSNFNPPNPDLSYSESSQWNTTAMPFNESQPSQEVDMNPVSYEYVGVQNMQTQNFGTISNPDMSNQQHEYIGVMENIQMQNFGMVSNEDLMNQQYEYG